MNIYLLYYCFCTLQYMILITSERTEVAQWLHGWSRWLVGSDLLLQTEGKQIDAGEVVRMLVTSESFAHLIGISYCWVCCLEVAVAVGGLASTACGLVLVECPGRPYRVKWLLVGSVAMWGLWFRGRHRERDIAQRW